LVLRRIYSQKDPAGYVTPHTNRLSTRGYSQRRQKDAQRCSGAMDGCNYRNCGEYTKGLINTSSHLENVEKKIRRTLLFVFRGIYLRVVFVLIWPGESHLAVPPPSRPRRSMLRNHLCGVFHKALLGLGAARGGRSAAESPPLPTLSPDSRVPPCNRYDFRLTFFTKRHSPF